MLSQLRKYWYVPGIACLGLCLVCAVVYHFSETTVDAQGFLHEKFFLVPLSWLWAIAAAIALTVGFFVRPKPSQN